MNLTLRELKHAEAVLIAVVNTYPQWDEKDIAVFYRLPERDVKIMAKALVDMGRPTDHGGTQALLTRYVKMRYPVDVSGKRPSEEEIRRRRLIKKIGPRFSTDWIAAFTGKHYQTIARDLKEMHENKYRSPGFNRGQMVKL